MRPVKTDKFGQEAQNLPESAFSTNSPVASSQAPNTGDDAIGTSDDTVGNVRAVLIVPVLQSTGYCANDATNGRLEEACGLAQAIDIKVVARGQVNVARAKPATLLGLGKVQELDAMIKVERAALCIVDHSLSPVQQRNLEKEWGVKVLDRTGLILEIFGRRARTKEGRLQVELAHLTYQKSRLVRSWTHLERQRGGFGFLGGPGETQIEADRRVIQDRISAIRKELETVRKTRALHREGRRRVPFPIIALVGYTNAGKSTLFNRFTGAAVQAEDLLFATLDPTMRQVQLPSGEKVILSDTVGFISDLPTTLIAAFRATLEEVIEADIVLHIRDIAHERTQSQAVDVYNVLEELGVEKDTTGRRIFEVWNKADMLDADVCEVTQNSCARREGDTVLVSAKTGQGMDSLLQLIDKALNSGKRQMKIEVAPADGALINWLYENAEILERSAQDTGATNLTFRIARPKLSQLNGMIGRGSVLFPQD